MGIESEVIRKSEGCAKAYSFLRFLILPIDEIEKTISKKGKIIDYGCGFGVNSCYLALSSKERHIVGIDHSAKRIKKAIKMAKGIRNLKFRLGNILKIRIEKAGTHLLIDALHHVPYSDQILLLEKIIQNMRKGDLIVIKEIDDRPVLKFAWNCIHDKLMNFNDKLYFRNQKWFEGFLNEKRLATKIKRCENLLYPHFIAIGKK